MSSKKLKLSKAEIASLKIKNQDSRIENLKEKIASNISLRVRAFDQAVEIGNDLLAIKTELPHGTFTDWIKINVQFIALRTVQKYTQLAKNEDLLRIELSESLGIEEAVKFLQNKKKNESNAKKRMNGVFTESEQKLKATIIDVRTKERKAKANLYKARQKILSGKIEVLPETTKKEVLEHSIKSETKIEKQVKDLEVKLEKAKAKLKKERIIKQNLVNDET